MVVAPEWIEPHWQGEAKQEVDVSEHEGPRVSVVQHGVQELVKLLTERPHPEETNQLQVVCVCGGGGGGGGMERRRKEGSRWYQKVASNPSFFTRRKKKLGRLGSRLIRRYIKS